MLDAERNPTMLGEWSERISQRRCHNCGVITLARVTCPHCGGPLTGVISDLARSPADRPPAPRRPPT
jgi:rRNA maturation protein Nop10